MNTLYIVCIHHPDQVHACRLASRTLVRDMSGDMQPYTCPRRVDQHLEKFFEDHKLCGGGFDHFALAFERPKDHDLPTPAPLTEAVNEALIEARDTANVVPIKRLDS